MDGLSTIQKIAVMALPLVFAIVFHEVAHGWVADRLGDPTARRMGRLTLNPIAHIDLFGTIIFPLVLILSNQPAFGYAKPVPINPYNFKNPKKGMAISSLAGPLTNFAMAFAFAVIYRAVLPVLNYFLPKQAWDLFGEATAVMCIYGVFINIALAFLNLIPIPPLDGSRIVYWLLPEEQGRAYYKIERFGIIILLALFLTGAIGKILLPIIKPILELLLGRSVA